MNKDVAASGAASSSTPQPDAFAEGAGEPPLKKPRKVAEPPSSTSPKDMQSVLAAKLAALED
eukprot:3076901-Lingulodinium_polyedra.AAC.1